MLKTKLRPLIQVANSQNYNDAYAGAHSQSTATPSEQLYSLEYDLNILRTQIRQLKGGGSFFDHIDDSAADGYTLSRIRNRLDNMESFVGATDGTDTSPTYSSSLNFSNDSSLESALGKIDGYVGAVSQGFAGTRILGTEATIYGALQNLDDGYASVQDQLDTFTFQRAYNQDPNGSNALITTNSTDGSFEIAGSEKLIVSATGGLKVDQDLDLNGLLDADVSSFDVVSAGIVSIDAGASSNFSTSVGDLDLSAALDLDLDGYTVHLDATKQMDIQAGADLNLSAISDLDLDGQTVHVNSSGQIDIQAGADLNLSAISDLDLDGQTVHVNSSGQMDVASGADLNLSAATDLDLDGATVHINASSTMDLASGGAMKIDSNSTLELEAYGKMIFDAQALGADALDIDSAGGIQINAAGAMTLDGYSFSIDASTNSNLSVTGADLTLSTLTSGSIKIDSSTTIEFLDSALANSIALTRGDANSVSSWTAGVSEAATSSGRDFSNMGIIQAVNALGDGYQSLSNEMDAFTLQRAYNQGKAAGEQDILVAEGDNLNIKLGGDNALFQVSNDDGSKTFTVRDGYVQVDGYLLVTGGTTQIETMVTDVDHMLLKPLAGSSTPALKIDPDAGFTQDLLVVEEVGTGAVAFMIENEGDAYFSNNVTMVGSLTTATLVLSPTADNVTSALRIDPYNGYTGDLLVVEEVGSDLPVFVVENDGDAYFGKNVTIEGSINIKGGNTGTSIQVDPIEGIAMESPQIINFYTYNEVTNVSSTVEVTNEYITNMSTIINNTFTTEFNITNDNDVSIVNITNEITNNVEITTINNNSTIINNSVTENYNITTNISNSQETIFEITNVDNSVTVNNNNVSNYNITTVDNSTTVNITNESITNNSTTINNAISNEYNITNENNVSIVNIQNVDNSVTINNTSTTINNISETVNNTINEYNISTTINNTAAPIVNITNNYEGDAYVVTINNTSSVINNTVNNYNISTTDNSTTINVTNEYIDNTSTTINNFVSNYNISTVDNSTTINVTDAYITNYSTTINNAINNEYNITNNNNVSIVNITNDNDTVIINNNSYEINNVSNTVYNEINEYNISTTISSNPVSIVEITNVAGDVTINNYGGQVNNFVSNEYNITNDNDISIVNITNDNDVITINNTSNTVNNTSIEINNISNTVYNEVNEYNISSIIEIGSAPAPIVNITNVYQNDAYVVTIENNSTVINNTSTTINNNISTVYNTSTTINNSSTTINNTSNTVNNTINEYNISTTTNVSNAPIVEITNVYQGDAYNITISNTSTTISNTISNEYNISTTNNNTNVYVTDSYTSIYSPTINNTINEYNISTTINSTETPIVEITNIYTINDGYTITINNTSNIVNNNSSTINNIVNSEYNISTVYDGDDIEIVTIVNNAGAVTINNASSITNNNIVTVNNTSTTITTTSNVVNNDVLVINNNVENYNITTTNNLSVVYVDDSYTSIYSPTINISTTEVTNIIVEDSYITMASDGYIITSSPEIILDSSGELLFADQRSAATGNPKGAFRLSTTATNFSGIVRSLASVAEGAELGIIDAINALATNVGSFEKAIYKIANQDARLQNGGKTLLLANPNRGSLDLVDNSEGYAPDFDPGRDLEVYVNGQFMLVDFGTKSFPAIADDDCFLESNHLGITFAFSLEVNDTIIIKNLKPRAGEDTSW